MEPHLEPAPLPRSNCLFTLPHLGCTCWVPGCLQASLPLRYLPGSWVPPSLCMGVGTDGCLLPGISATCFLTADLPGPPGVERFATWDTVPHACLGGATCAGSHTSPGPHGPFDHRSPYMITPHTLHSGSGTLGHVVPLRWGPTDFYTHTPHTHTRFTHSFYLLSSAVSYVSGYVLHSFWVHWAAWILFQYRPGWA